MFKKRQYINLFNKYRGKTDNVKKLFGARTASLLVNHRYFCSFLVS